MKKAKFLILILYSAFVATNCNIPPSREATSVVVGVHETKTDTFNNPFMGKDIMIRIKKSDSIEMSGKKLPGISEINLHDFDCYLGGDLFLDFTTSFCIMANSSDVTEDEVKKPLKFFPHIIFINSRSLLI